MTLDVPRERIRNRDKLLLDSVGRKRSNIAIAATSDGRPKGWGSYPNPRAAPTTANPGHGRDQPQEEAWQ